MVPKAAEGFGGVGRGVVRIKGMLTTAPEIFGALSGKS